MAQWINVNERLPERDSQYAITEEVLVCITNPDIGKWKDITLYHFGVNGWLSDDPGVTLEEVDCIVTHWMPLPELPE